MVKLTSLFLVDNGCVARVTSKNLLVRLNANVVIAEMSTPLVLLIHGVGSELEFIFLFFLTEKSGCNKKKQNSELFSIYNESCYIRR